MSDRAPYSRVYWEVQSDPKFDGIREDMRLMGSWLTLLLVADQAWPAPAYPPPIVPKAALRALVEAGLVDMLTGGRFRVRGLEAERTKRSDKASNAAAVRWQSERIADGMPRRDETSIDETRRDEHDDGRADLEAFLLVTRRAPTPRQRKLLDSLLDRHDLTGPQWAADIILRNPNDPIGAVIEADKAWRAERIAEAQAAEKPKPQPRRSHGLPQTTRDILAEMQRLAKDDAA
jgi:hypothetical protein